jgi:hypothetical protein
MWWQHTVEHGEGVTKGTGTKQISFETRDSAKWTKFGYALMAIDARGCGRSPGTGKRRRSSRSRMGWPNARAAIARVARHSSHYGRRPIHLSHIGVSTVGPDLEAATASNRVGRPSSNRHSGARRVTAPTSARRNGTLLT